MFRIRVRDLVAVVSFALAAHAAGAQTDLAGSLYGAFSGTTNGNGVQQSPANAAGVLVELRHIRNPLIGYEVTYAFNHNNQTYTQAAAVCGLTCSTVVSSKYVPANAHQITADYIVSVPILGFRPFVLAGGGLELNVPSGSTGQTSTSTQAVFVYGAGLDYTILPHIGIRGQYRGSVYKAPQLATAFSSTGAFTKTAEPMVGAYLRF
ncbi:Opacity protein [Bryocella elongata]|uniref:Opacity protein n=1 Tax=Bryocella elongata TaxID=863522 RepID=A0A1H5ZGP6_9BACT|nr:outer membrane beta-barrel protein [Bryocella elongata]SEG35649.1 Opacity protein [Bryocella elongata]